MRRCFSAAPSNKRWVPIFAGKIPEQSCSPNGPPAQNQGLHYSNRDSWDRMLRQGIMLLDRFCQEDRIQIRQPQRNLQIKFTRQVAGNNDFVAYIDAIGKLDGRRSLLEWKTSSSRYPEEPQRAALPRSSTCVLLVDDGHRRSCSSGFRPQARGRNSISAHYHHATSSARNSATWSRTRSEGLNPRSSCRTVASAFRRIRAAVVRMWDSVSESRRWLTRV